MSWFWYKVLIFQATAGYDLNFEGGEDYSFMDAMVERGFGAVTFSIRGYAQSELNVDPLTVQTEQAIEDLAAVIDWLNKTGYCKTTPSWMVLGWTHHWTLRRTKCG